VSRLSRRWLLPRARLVFLRVVTLAGLSALLGGCDPRADLDELVDDVWLYDHRSIDAVEYFSSGGEHYDLRQVDGAASVDSTHVLPLMKRLAELKTEPIALFDEDNGYCWVILVKLPIDSIGRSRVESAVKQADRKFPGVIEAEWGNKWLALNFEDAKQAADE
jgi:hypothetical protein